MRDWKITCHMREVRWWDSELRRRVSKNMPTVECRSKFGDAHALITVRENKVLLSLNGSATITRADLEEMARVVDHAEAELRVYKSECVQ